MTINQLRALVVVLDSDPFNSLMQVAERLC